MDVSTKNPFCFSKTGFYSRNQPTRSTVHLHVTVFTLWEDYLPKLESVDLVAQAMREMAIGTSDEWRFGVVHHIMFVIVEPRFGERILVAFDARLVLDRHDDHGRLARDVEIELGGVPGCQRKDLGAPKDPLATMAIDTLNVFFAMMKCGQVLRITLCDSTRKAREKVTFGLSMTRAAKLAVLLEVAGVAFAREDREHANGRDQQECLPTRELHFAAGTHRKSCHCECRVRRSSLLLQGETSFATLP
jgi:hypothetical protein